MRECPPRFRNLRRETLVTFIQQCLCLSAMAVATLRRSMHEVGQTYKASNTQLPAVVVHMRIPLSTLQLRCPNHCQLSWCINTPLHKYGQGGAMMTLAAAVRELNKVRAPISEIRIVLPSKSAHLVLSRKCFHHKETSKCPEPCLVCPSALDKFVLLLSDIVFNDKGGERDHISVLQGD